jgi:hypothetical protein
MLGTVPLDLRTLGPSPGATFAPGFRIPSSLRFNPILRFCPICYTINMTRLLDEAIETLRDLPEEEQDAAADALFAYISSDEREYRLHPEGEFVPEVQQN